MPRQINSEGLQLVKDSEGLRLEKYRDVAGKWTIGYGHLIVFGHLFNSPITEQQATELLESDLFDAETAVEHLVKVPLTDNQFAALVDFTYNLGRTNFEASTLLWDLNAGRYQQAADEFDKWIYAGGRRIEGLVVRRAKEKALFLKGDQ